MLIPVSTDAPVYHFPFGTIGLIAINTVVFMAAFVGDLDAEAYCLILGDGLHPVQWITHFFLHGNIFHLIGNMIFLWCFGLVVEGKLGWARFVPLYLCLGTTVGVIAQTLMLSADESQALGASAAIFGVVMIAGIWAPKNEVNMVWFLGLRIIGGFSVPVLMVVFWYLMWDGATFIVTGFTMSGAAAHLLGAVLGLAVGLVWVRQSWVDCDGLDIISVALGREGETSATESRGSKRDDAERKRTQNLIAEGRPQVTRFLEQKNADAAVRLFEKLRQLDPRLVWEQHDLLDAVNQLLATKQWDLAARYMEEFVRLFPNESNSMRLHLAKLVLVHHQRPGRALGILAEVQAQKLAGKELDLYRKLISRAKQMQNEGTVELREGE